MDFRVMPQVDKSASTYSPPVQYVPGIASTSNLTRPEMPKFGVPSDILTSCDWSAVIHRPAEDSEPEDLPSTVDIDAIKEPATPLPSMTPCPHPDDDGSDSDDEDSSGSESDAGSSSDSESPSQDVSGSGSSLSEDSDSSDASASGKKQHVNSESSESPLQEESPNAFSSTVKLKLSKPSPSHSSSSSSSSSSSENEETSKGVSQSPDKLVAANPTAAETVKNAAFKGNASVSRLSSTHGKEVKDLKPSKVIVSSERNKNPLRTSAAKSPGSVSQTSVRRAAFRPASQSKTVVPSRKSSRVVRKPPRTRRSGTAVEGESSSQSESSDEDDKARGNADEITNLAHQLRVQGISDPLEEINQEDLAAILPDVTGGGSLDGFEESAAHSTSSRSSSSSSSSSSSDSDTEQIVSDVISRIQDESEPPPPSKSTARTNVHLSPSSPLSGKSSRNQIGSGYSSNLLADFVEKTELLSRGGGSVSSSSDCPQRNEEKNSEAAPSSSSEEVLKRRRGRPSRQLRGGNSTGNQNSITGMPELEAYMRLDCSQSNVSPDSGIQSVAGSPAGAHHSPPGSPRSPVPPSHICGPPVLSKASSPSPSHQNSLFSSNEKISKMVASTGKIKVDNGVKKGPSRPKVSVHGLATFGRRRRKRLKKTDNQIKNSIIQLKEQPDTTRRANSEPKLQSFVAGDENSYDEDDHDHEKTRQENGPEGLSRLPTLPAIMMKRGRGRPKKSPPVLEPNFPMPNKELSPAEKKSETISDTGLLTLSDKSKELALKCARIAFTKGLIKNKEHKHKKRKKHGPEFRRLDPEFLSELSRLADMIRVSCYISSTPTKNDVPKIKETGRQSKSSRKQKNQIVEEAVRNETEMKQQTLDSSSVVDIEESEQREDRCTARCKDSKLSRQSENQGSAKSNISKKEKRSSKNSKNKDRGRTKAALRERNRNRNSSGREKRSSKSSKKKNRASSPGEKSTRGLFERKNEFSPVNVAHDNKDRDESVNNESSNGENNRFVSKGESSTQTVQFDPDGNEKHEDCCESIGHQQGKVDHASANSDKLVSLAPEISPAQENSTKSKITTTSVLRDRNSARDIQSSTKDKGSKPARDGASHLDKEASKTQNDQSTSDVNNDKDKSTTVPSKDKIISTLPTKERTSTAVSKDKLKERSVGSTGHHSKEKLTSNLPLKDRDTKVASGPNLPGAASLGQKRRIKKSTVDCTKKEKTEETSSNEQRLPLKKRHYVTSASSVVSENSETSETSGESEVKTSGEESPNQQVITPTPPSTAVSKTETKKQDKWCVNDKEVVSPKDELSRSQGSPRPSKSHVDSDRKSRDVAEPVPKRTPLRTCTSLSNASGSTPFASKRMSTRHSSIKTAAGDQQFNGVTPLKRSQRLKTKNEEDDGKHSTQVNAKETAKRQTKSHDEPLEQKLTELVKNGDNPCSDTQINTRLSSKVCPSVGCLDNNSDTVKTAPDAGIFEPSVESPSEILKLPLPPQSEVLNKMKSKLLPQDQDINMEEELKSIKRSTECRLESTGPGRPKRRKTEGDVKPTVESASDKTPITVVKLKIKRKKINRTGFPVKKKKKKRSEIHVATNSSAPPVLEDQTKLKVSTDVDVSTPALSPGLSKIEGVDASKPDETSQPVLLDRETEVVLSDTKKKTLPEMTETVALPIRAGPEKCGEPLTSPRPASKRIQELKARSEAVVGQQKKRKPTADESQEEEENKKEASEEGPEMKFLTKKTKRCKDELDDSDAESVKLGKKILPKWRKKYLPAGLFSDYFKEDEPRKIPTEKTKSDTEIVDLLPPPTYCAKWVRQRKLPFQLPHDIWWLHTHNQLPGREAVPSWNYRKLRTNFYFDVKPSYGYEAQACNCKPSEEVCCGDDCINRMVYAECSPQLCPCKDKCSNQKIQRHDWAPGLTKFMTKDKGWGVKTKQKITKDEFILEYVGEVVSEKEFKSRMASRYQNDTHHYCLNLDGGLVIDGHRMGGDGRFVNHSCEPNCEMQKWCVNGLFRMALFALRDIHPNEELTYDYNFSLFNPSEGQPCKCGSTKCRGVIGGKYQRVIPPGSSTVSSVAAGEKEKALGQVGRPRKSSSASTNRRKSLTVDKKIASNKTSRDVKTSQSKENSKEAFGNSTLATVAARLCHMTQLKPMMPEQKLFVIENKIFLLRTLQKVKERVEKLREAVKSSGLLAVCDATASNTSSFTTAGSNGTSSSMCASSSLGTAVNGASSSSIITKEGEKEVFMSQLKALSNPRSVRTRRLALAEDNPEMTKAARLACVFKNLYSEVINFKDESGDYLSSNFISLPSKRKSPLYYQRIQNPIDLNTIDQNIVTGVYKTVESFDLAMNTLFKNNVKWYGRLSDLGIAATRLRKVYNLAKLECISKLEEILGEPPPASFVPARDDPSGEEEDVIRCICGMFRDEGLMIQCERCLVWQHCYCVKANSSVEKYLCERCNPREVDLEIPSQEEPDDNSPGQTNYLTLLRGDMQLKQGDTVYVLRDIVNEESISVPKAKHTYKTIKNWKYIDCDIFKIERLWKDEKGDRFAFGHHYLRPHETFHEPTRKFFPNELMRVPLYEVVPVDLIMDNCYVLDLNTYCKGRPLGSNPDHIYVCEYRVDKVARMFAKIPKPKHSVVCTKSYSFETYDARLKPQRTYAPHGPPKENWSSSLSTTKETKDVNVARVKSGKNAQHTEESNSSSTTPQPVRSQQLAHYPPDKRLAKKMRLDRILQKLLAKLPSKQPLDLSYLLEPGRRQRKKPLLLVS